MKDNAAMVNPMQQVTWTVECTTLVDTEDDQEAIQAVNDLFEQRPWGKTGKCVLTLEQMRVEGTAPCPSG